MFSVMVKLLLCPPVAKFNIQYLQDRLKRIITNIFAIRKFDFQISGRIYKAKCYFCISVLWYISVGFMQKIWKIFREANIGVNFFITDI